MRNISAEEDYGMEGIRDEVTHFCIVQKLDKYAEINCDIVKSAAWIIYSITITHPFFQANKRTAFATADIIRGHCGLMIKVDPKEGERFIIDVAMEKNLLDSVEAWFRGHVARR